MKAVIWNYKFPDMKQNWARQTRWLAYALQNAGVEVKAHKDFICKELPLPIYDFAKDYDADICIYNHTDQSYIIGNVLKVNQNWFFKPTVPDKFHTTLDELGYGPYSSITYNRPDFESVNIGDFFDTKVKSWIDKKVNKWGAVCVVDDLKIIEDNYYLILGQCGGDSVVTHFDFGHYFTKLEQITKELVRVGDRPVVVKLHPYTDGEEGTRGSYKNGEFSLGIKKKLEAISPKVKVYLGKVNIHNFIKKAYCVFLANSGAGFEVMMHHKPIISWGHPEYHWVTYDLRHLAEIRNAIKLDWFDSNKQDKFLYWYMEKYCFYDQESCNRRVKELLQSIPKDNFDDLWRKHHPSQGVTEWKLFIEFLQHHLKPNPVIVEIGVRRGNQRYFYKQLFNADYKGIDIINKNNDDFIIGDSNNVETLNKLKQWLNGRRIDLLFIDGDHAYKSVKKDYELYGNLADMVVFHDIDTKNPINTGVVKFWNELPKKKAVEFKCSEPKVQYRGDGIGIILQ